MTAGLNWRDQAACRTVSPDLFFAHEDEGRRARALRERSARMVCASCPVTGLDGPCVQWAIQTGDQHSISGGMTPEERTATRRGAGPMLAAARRRAVIEAAGEKPCTGPCGQTKPLSQFGLSKDGWRGDCKDCRNAYLRRQRREAAQQEERETA